MSSWDHEAIYDEKISPLMAQIIAICKEHDIPMYATVQYAGGDTPEDVKMCTTILTYGIPGEATRELRSCDAIIRRGWIASSPVMAMTITGVRDD